ncbi:hypothetical protein K437DRAFT_269821 [Tilletiaria anomala UBC 951]|uniref:Uncharacterized protein n=1 Tax=Tilletiaria anomala (strain ATCC 24038 / CBS 436.72 / UBC 951) TaxID=1037660 RepID=A0A066VH63_TILAU|nr:uncharacterized protein K437DRAFT_269821 [Tilletiaria anomala UBC 951]KDN41077.1 hypothetical protein K437DRAFT_269821 [Tilletiaria anomala UBC 951]
MSEAELTTRLAKFVAVSGELAQLVKRSVLRRDEGDFDPRSGLFNAAVALNAWLLDLPVNTEDVVAILKFCNAHGFSPSVKSGGYATAGWAIQEGIIIVMRLMDSVRMHVPRPLGVALPEAGTPMLAASSSVSCVPQPLAQAQPQPQAWPQLTTTILTSNVAAINERAKMVRQYTGLLAGGDSSAPNCLRKPDIIPASVSAARGNLQEMVVMQEPSFSIMRVTQ